MGDTPAYKQYVADLLAGVSTVTIGHSVDIVKVKLQKHNTEAHGIKYKNSLHCTAKILRTEGIRDLIEASSGVHFSGFHMNGLQERHSNVDQPTTSATDNILMQPFVIGVAGGAASGKTIVCDMIIQQLHDQRDVLVNQDSFYHNLTPEEHARVHEYNFDHPDAFDNEKLLASMDKLRNGQAVDIPNYDFKSYKDNVFPPRRVNPSDVIILEGILIFHDPRVRELMNMKIFVDIDADVRLARRIRRDTVEKNRDIGTVLDQSPCILV
ncbi:uridine kinase-like protein 3 isoform X2 [Humulus lupulus]|uniref:uridine kinase-like protein 3 isoform X2 n=1 Tax=Humulus lupulus TaxID=3486 RepID=UPI002B40120A|nr:uridine kinase-like protein 3 isoform X2 [Humulus lupulus]